jgi:hypothetical protein
MKKLLFYLIVFTTFNTFAQDKSEIREFFWGKSDAYKTAVTVPEKWKNESAIILLKYEFYDYHKYGKNVTYTSAIRKRIKLQDAASVKEFSEFSFKNKFYSNKGQYWYQKESTNYIGVRIIKPNGKEIEIDTEKEIKTLDKESKLAISTLEIGDVMDYYYYSIENFRSKEEVGFDPVETPLGDVYPIVDFKLDFQTENDFFVNFNTYNGAPELKEIPTNKGNERKYELVTKDIEKNEFPRWFYPLVELPCYKFQVYFARTGTFEQQAEAFLSDREKYVKKTVTKEDIFEYYNKKFVSFGDTDLEKKFLKGKTFANEEEKIREVYYYMRHEYFTQYIEAQAISEAKIFPAFYLYSSPIFFADERSFIRHFMSFLRKNDIDYDIIVGTTRDNGSIEDLLIQKNVNVLMRINTSKPFYLEYFTPFTSADQFNYNLENTKAYVLQVAKGKKIVDAELVVLPATTFKDNVSSIFSNVKFNDDLSGLKVQRLSNFIGHFKETEQAEKLLFFDYLDEDFNKYGSKHPIDMVSNKKDKARYQTEFEALKITYKEKQKEACKKSISEEFDFEIDNNTFSVKSSGRFGSKTPFSYQEDFEIKNNLIKKAGENYIVELGKMITAQVEIDKKEKDRKNNVYLAFPRTFENEITFEIPTGYAVSGIEKFNKSIVNETGEFVSKATISGNKVVVKTSKVYNNYFEPNINWNKMILFLDAAYQLTQEKILLKKI